MKRQTSEVGDRDEKCTKCLPGEEENPLELFQFNKYCKPVLLNVKTFINLKLFYQFQQRVKKP